METYSLTGSVQNFLALLHLTLNSCTCSGISTGMLWAALLGGGFAFMVGGLAGASRQHSHPNNNTMSRNEKFWVDQVTPPPPPGERQGVGNHKGGGGMLIGLPPDGAGEGWSLAGVGRVWLSAPNTRRCGGPPRARACGLLRFAWDALWVGVGQGRGHLCSLSRNFRMFVTGERVGAGVGMGLALRLERELGLGAWTGSA